MLAASAGLLVMAVGLAGAAVPVVALGMLAYGVGTSTWDVAMNVEGADVERRLGRTIMPRFHAGFSVGTVLGALVGAGCAKAGVSLEWQLAVTVVAILVVGLGGVRAVPAAGRGRVGGRQPVLGAGRLAGAADAADRPAACWRSRSARASPTTGWR